MYSSNSTWRKKMERLAGLEPTTSSSAGTRSIQLSYKRKGSSMVPKERFELTHPHGYYDLNVARLPFRHFGTYSRQTTTQLKDYRCEYP